MSGHCEKCGNTQCICDEVSGDNLCKGAGDDQICKCAASSGDWFDRTISQRADGTEGMAYVCNDCGNEVSTAGENRG